MFQFPSFASRRLWIHQRDIQTLLWMGCPIRTSPDQSPLSGSPKLIAANHVLHRLLAPRHPPHALSSLTINQILNIYSCQRTFKRMGLRRPLHEQKPMELLLRARRAGSRDRVIFSRSRLRTKGICGLYYTELWLIRPHQVGASARNWWR